MTHSAEPSRDPAQLLGSLIRESEQLRSDVARREERQRREFVEREQRQRRLMSLLGAGLIVSLVMIVAVVVLLVQSRGRGADTRALIRANAATNQRIADCTSPDGTCYQEGAKRQAEAIQKLIDAQKQIALCRAGSDSLAELEGCIDKAVSPIVGVTPAPTGRSTT